MEVARRQTQEIAFRRYRLNQWVRTNVESWLPAGAWDACRSELDLEDGLPVWVGVDVALKRDSTAVVVVQPQGERLVARAKVWHPDLVTMDLAGVEQYLRELHARFEVREIAFDPAFFQRSAEALADDGLPMVEFAQSPQRMVPAIATTYDMVVNRVVAHSGDPMFADQVLSAAPRSTDSGIRLSKGKSRRKIDAAIALVMAVDRATRKAEPAPSPGFFVI